MVVWILARYVQRVLRELLHFSAEYDSVPPFFSWNMQLWRVVRVTLLSLFESQLIISKLWQGNVVYHCRESQLLAVVLVFLRIKSINWLSSSHQLLTGQENSFQIKILCYTKGIDSLGSWNVVSEILIDDFIWTWLHTWDMYINALSEMRSPWRYEKVQWIFP